MHRVVWILTSLTLLQLMPAAASAQIVNGDFENAGDGWFAIAIPPWTVTFLPDGGNPNGHVVIQSPSSGIQGLGAILQGFQCGIPESGSQCMIMFDYRLRQIDASPNSGRIQVFIDENPAFTSPSGDIDWTTGSVAVPCGDHSIALALSVDTGNNAWEAAFDNVQADCELSTPVAPSTWGGIKSTFEPTTRQ